MLKFLAMLIYRVPGEHAVARQPPADVAGRQHLRSAKLWKLIVLRYRLNTCFGRRCFAVARARRPGILYQSP